MPSLRNDQRQIPHPCVRLRTMPTMRLPDDVVRLRIRGARMARRGRRGITSRWNGPARRNGPYSSNAWSAGPAIERRSVMRRGNLGIDREALAIEDCGRGVAAALHRGCGIVGPQLL